MAYSSKTYTADGVTTDFVVTFNYLDRSHVFVRVNFIDTSQPGSLYTFEWLNDTTIRIRTVVDSLPVPNGLGIEIYRVTPINTPAVVFGSGAALPARALNKSVEYLTFALQEATDENEEFTKLYLGSYPSAPLVDREGQPIQVGAVYYNTTDGGIYYWNGTSWQVGDNTNLANAARVAAEAAQAAAEAAAALAVAAADAASSGGGVAVLIVPDGTDATAFLQAELDTFGAAGGGRVVIRRQNINDPIRMDGRVSMQYSNIQVDFQSPVEFGPLGSLRARGDIAEFLRVGTTTPKVLVPAYNDPITGKATFEIASGKANEFLAGDFVVIRGLVTAADGTIEKQVGIVETVDLVNDIITLTEPLAVFDDQEDLDAYNAIMGTSLNLGDPYQFLPNYVDVGGNQLYNPISGAPSEAKLSPLRASAPATGSFTKGQVILPVTDGTIFTVGDIVEIRDDRTEDETSGQPGLFTTQYNAEMKRVSKVVGNDVYLDGPLRMDYDNAFKARVQVLVPLKYIDMTFRKIYWHTPGTSTNMHAMHLDICAHSKVRCKEMDGWAGKVGAAARFTACYDCHVEDTAVHGGYNWDAPANYGAVIYRSSFCSIKRCHISHQRHGILISGSDHIDIKDCVITDDFISAIDTHGTGNYNILIEGNRVVAGENIYGSGKAGIRVGNPSHVLPDTDVIVRDNFVMGYDGPSDRGIDFCSPATNVQIEGNTVQDCTVGVSNLGNSSTRVTTKVYTDTVLIQRNTFFQCGKGIDLEDTPLPGSKGLEDVLVFENVFKECAEYVQVNDVVKFIAKGNKVVDPTDLTKVMFDLTNIGSVQIDGQNDSADLNNPVRLTDILNAVVIYNAFGFSGAILEVGTTTGTTSFANDHTPPAAGGGGGTGLSIERYNSGIVADRVLTDAQIPNDTTIPLQSEGEQVWTQSVISDAGQTVEVEAVFPYVEIAGSTGAVTITLWEGSTLIGVATSRVTNGAASGNYMVVRGTYTATGSNLIEVRMGHTDGTTDITLKSRFGDAITEPYLMVRRATAAATVGAAGVPAGGTTGQVLVKASGTDFDIVWGAPSIVTEYNLVTDAKVYVGSNAAASAVALSSVNFRKIQLGKLIVLQGNLTLGATLTTSASQEIWLWLTGIPADFYVAPTGTILVRDISAEVRDRTGPEYPSGNRFFARVRNHTGSLWEWMMGSAGQFVALGSESKSYVSGDVIEFNLMLIDET